MTTPTRRTRAARTTTIASAVLALVAGTLLTAPAASAAGPTPDVPAVQQRSAGTVTADALPTVQIDDGIVWAQTMIGNTVYAGGSFSNARPAGAAKGTSLTPRSNLLAYDVTTGNLKTGWAPSVNGTVKSLAVSPDKTRVYVGGSFTVAGGQTRYNLAAFDATSGALVSTFKPAVGGSYVNAIAVTNDAVYVGGLIGAAGGIARKNLAALNPADGKPLAWAPTTDLQVDAMTLTPSKDKLIIGGRFGTVNGASQRGLAALSLSSGAVLPWTAPSVVVNGVGSGSGAGKAGILSLNADDHAIYGTGWVFSNVSVGNLEGSFSADPDTGAIRWIADCHGDTNSVFSDGSTTYTTSHNHDCQTLGGMPQLNPAPGNLRHAVATTSDPVGTLGRSPSTGSIYKDWSGWPAPAVVNWAPDWVTGTTSGQGAQAGWSTTGNGDYLSVGGEFPAVNGRAQYGLVRFARAALTDPSQGPRLSGADWTPTASTLQSGTVRVTAPVNWDRDDLNLTYELRRDGVSGAVATTTQKSAYWTVDSVGLTDPSATAGQSYTYRLVAKDGDGNQATSNPVTVTAGSGTASSAYSRKVVDDGASLFWRMGAGSTAGQDWAGANDGGSAGGVAVSSSGAISGDPGKASTLNGSATSRITEVDRDPVPRSFSVEAWVKTSTTRGGRIVGYGNGTGSNNSGQYDRTLYMRNDGRLQFGVNQGGVKVLTSPNAYNDNRWHHVVATLNPSSGSALTIDGTQVATSSTMTYGASFMPADGRWRVGADTLSGWPNRPTSDYLTGDVDEVAVYPKVLSTATIQSHYAAAGYTVPGGVLPEPTASFTSTTNGLTASVDASGSTAGTDSSITSYAWTWGDGATSTGQTASHAYASAGTYTVGLTVTNAAGQTSSTTKQVTVSRPADPPTASFTASGSGSSASVDASASTADGGSLDYAWSWGDGSSSTGGPTTSHAYTAGGNYTITLTVTDARGATDTATRSVTVTDPADTSLARDTFGRSLSSGWGTADKGGSWSDATGLTVSDGAGRMNLSAAKANRKTYLSGSLPRDVDVALTMSLDKLADGSGTQNDVIVRRTANGFYHLKVRVSATGVVSVSLGRTVGTTETLLTTKTVSGTYTPGSTLGLRLQATGGGTTTLNAKAWISGSEPSAWTTTATDTTADLQSAGQVGLGGYLPSSVTNAPVTMSFDDLVVQAP